MLDRAYRRHGGDGLKVIAVTNGRGLRPERIGPEHPAGETHLRWPAVSSRLAATGPSQGSRMP